MAWNDLTIAQRSQWMNKFRRLGISDLAQMRQTYDAVLSVPSLSSLEGPDDIRFSPAPMYKRGGKLFYQGGDEETAQPEYRMYNGTALTLEEYKELQRQAATNLAVKKALERDRGVAPIINGQPDSSCLYTATDNFGNKYRAASNPLFFKDPKKFGFEVAGPMSENPEENVGRLYQQIDETGRPFHMNFITGVGNDGKNKVTYSRGHAGNTPMTRKEWNKREVADIERMTKMATSFGKKYDPSRRQTYDEYYKQALESYNTDYVKNKNLWDSYGYETYRFVGKPEDNTAWEEQYNALPSALSRINGIKVQPYINNRVEVLQQDIMAKGGKIHINPKNKGKFNATKARTGKTTEELTHSKNPLTRRRAIFAQNAAKWKHKHSYGGFNF